MKIKKGIKVSTQEFWYDLTDGGYLNPFGICENQEDGQKVIDAIAVIKDFESSCEKQIEGFVQ